MRTCTSGCSGRSRREVKRHAESRIEAHPQNPLHLGARGHSPAHLSRLRPFDREAGGQIRGRRRAYGDSPGHQRVRGKQAAVFRHPRRGDAGALRLRRGAAPRAAGALRHGLRYTARDKRQGAGTVFARVHLDIQRLFRRIRRGPDLGGHLSRARAELLPGAAGNSGADAP